MTPATGWIFYIFVFVILSIVVTFSYFMSRRDIKDSYLLHIKKRSIDWIKVRNFYIMSNILSYIASINNDMMNWVDVILIPITFISFLLTYYFVYPDPDQRQSAINKINQKDFQKYKKEKDREKIENERNQKINKILK